MPTVKTIAASFAVAFIGCLLVQASCTALMAQERVYRFTETDCPDCTCEEVKEKLDELLSREPLTCPAPMPLCSAAKEGMPCLTWKETVPPVTGGSVRERLWLDDAGGLRLGDVPYSVLVNKEGASWSSQHPKWHKALKWGGWALGAYAFDRVAHHNDWLWYHGQHDEDTRNVTIINEGDVTVICKGNCR